MDGNVSLTNIDVINLTHCSEVQEFPPSPGSRLRNAMAREHGGTSRVQRLMNS
jgi:hypothetical protein